LAGVKQVVAGRADFANGGDPHPQHPPQPGRDEVVANLRRHRVLALERAACRTP
jgi:hypothetical protein